MTPAPPIAIINTGLVTSVGLSAPASCAAIRAKISNPTETRFLASDGGWIMAHQVPLVQPWRGVTKLAKMAAMAIAECLVGISKEEWQSMPLLLCIAEPERPGRPQDLDSQLFHAVEQDLKTYFSAESQIFPYGRVGLAIALAHARQIIENCKAKRVILAAADSLLTWPTLSFYERNERLLTAANSNGFIAGEAGGALLIGQPRDKAELLCSGIGFGVEKANIDSDEPFRAEGMVFAIKAALADAGCEMHDLDYRISDMSGEQYYFKEAALAFSRITRRRKDAFDIWHPAECIGEAGAAAGIVGLALADAACRKAYSVGPHILFHLSNDCGRRAAVVLHYRDPR